MHSNDEYDIPLDELKELYDAADQIWEQACWNWMDPDDLFSVSLPDSGIKELGYGSYLPKYGDKAPGILVFLGDRGLNSYERLCEEKTYNDRLEGLVYQRSLHLTFENYRDLTTKDRRAIKSIGKKYSGKHSWPQFRSYLPGYMPWELSLSEVRYFTQFLTRAYHYALDRYYRPKEFSPPDDKKRWILHAERKKDKPWKYDWRELTFPQWKDVDPLDFDELQLYRLKKAFRKQNKEWEFGIFTIDNLMDAGELRPVVVQQAMTADRETAAMYDSYIFMCSQRGEQLVPALIQAIENAQHLPNCFVVSDEHLAQQLRPILKKLGVGIRCASDLHALEFARQSFEKIMEETREAREQEKE